MPTFTIAIRAVHQRQGLINVPADVDRHIGPHGGPIEVFLSTQANSVLSTINRQANNNGTARIAGRMDIARWFGQFPLSSTITAEILTPNSILLYPSSGSNHGQGLMNKPTSQTGRNTPQCVPDTACTDSQIRTPSSQGLALGHKEINETLIEIEPSVPVTSSAQHNPDPINLNVHIVNLRLTPVYRLTKGTSLIKANARKNNRELCAACENVKDANLCYYWKTDDQVLYIGKAKPYQQYESSLLGRIIQYLQNRKIKNGELQQNQNKRIFDAINRQLQHSDVEFGRFQFDFVTTRDFTLDYQSCSMNRYVIEMLEQVLIGFYKLQGQATLNL